MKNGKSIFTFSLMTEKNMVKKMNKTCIDWPRLGHAPRVSHLSCRALLGSVTCQVQHGRGSARLTFPSTPVHHATFPYARLSSSAPVSLPHLVGPSALFSEALRLRVTCN